LSSWSFLLSSSVSFVLLLVTMVRGLLASSSSSRIWAGGGADGAVPASRSWAAASAGGEELVDVVLVGVAMVVLMSWVMKKLCGGPCERADGLGSSFPTRGEEVVPFVPVRCVCGKG